MKAYRFFPDGIYDCEVELDGNKLRPFHTTEAPPVRAGFYAVMRDGWQLVEGDKPVSKPPEIDKAGLIVQKRDAILASTVDRLNPIWWDSMTDEKKQEWRDYRQALLDVTKQSTFPQFVIWPQEPEHTAPVVVHTEIIEGAV